MKYAILIINKWTGKEWIYPRTFYHEPTQREIDLVMSGISDNNTHEILICKQGK